MLRYKHSFVLQSCHFNDDTYALYQRALQERDFDLMVQVARECHGHNFIATVSVEGTPPEGASWLVDSRLLHDLVMEWNDVNLSLHADFYGVRATTENMAKLLALKVDRLLKAGVRVELRTPLFITVRVEERPEISATYSM